MLLTLIAVSILGQEACKADAKGMTCHLPVLDPSLEDLPEIPVHRAVTVRETIFGPEAGHPSFLLAFCHGLVPSPRSYRADLPTNLKDFYRDPLLHAPTRLRALEPHREEPDRLPFDVGLLELHVLGEQVVHGIELPARLRQQFSHPASGFGLVIRLFQTLRPLP